MTVLRILPGLLMMLSIAITCFGDEETGRISGRWVSVSEKPIAEGLVYFFDDALGPPPLPERYWRGADHTFLTGTDGRFTAALPPGNYYLGTVKRKGSAEKGPLQQGDLYTLSRDSRGKPKVFAIRQEEKVDIGTIRGGRTYRKAYRMKGMTAIQGTVRDEHGNPAPGVLVFAYPTPEMTGRPLYTSDRTGEDGTFLLRLGSGGEFYLKIRSNYGGGQPEAGELMGGYGEFGAPAVVIVKQGAITKGIHIRGKRFPGRVKKID